MALIIEDGTIVLGANSLASDADLVAYAALRNITLPATEALRDVLMLAGMSYITSKESQLKGCRVSPDQTLPYPRHGMCVNGFPVSSSTIHPNAKISQIELAILANTSGLFVDGQNQNVQREKLGKLEVEYFSGGSWESIRTDSADVYLMPLMKNNGSQNILTRV